jgi:hypothetical protein
MDRETKTALFALAFVGAFLVAVWLTTTGQLDRPDPSKAWLFQYQDLVGGLLSLAAATAGVVVVLRQIREQRAQFREEIERQRERFREEGLQATESRRAEAGAAARHLSGRLFANTCNSPSAQCPRTSPRLPDTLYADSVIELFGSEQFTRLRHFVGGDSLQASFALYDAAHTLRLERPTPNSEAHEAENAALDPEGAHQLYKLSRAALEELDHIAIRMTAGWQAM